MDRLVADYRHVETPELVPWRHYHQSERNLPQRLRGEQRELFVHHRPTNCGQMLITHDGATCHVVFTRAKRRRADFSRIHHISNQEVFHSCLEHVRWHMALRNRTPALAIDGRLFVGPRPTHSRETKIVQVALYRSETLRPEQID